MTRDELPPCAEISERTIIGQCMIYDYCTRESAQLLGVDDFYFDRNRILYRIMLKLNADGAIPDVQLVGQRVLDRGYKDRIGGLKVLSEYIDSVCTGQNLSYHARIIKEKAALRKLMALASDITHTAAQQTDPQGFIEESKRTLIELAQSNAERKEVESITDNIASEVGQIMSGKEPAELVKTGIPSLDRKTGGLFSSLPHVVAGLTSMGKSALLLNIAINIGLRNQRALYITLEDAAQYQRRRMIARLAKADLHRIMINQPNADESKRIIQAHLDLAKRKQPLFWIHDSARTPEQILYTAATHKATVGLDVLMVDHLGFIQAPGKDEYHQVSNAMREITNMAKELAVPIVLAVQLSRGNKERRAKNPRPVLRDLRGSGHIEQDARAVWFVHREKDTPDVMEIKIAKQSHGPTGMVKMHCNLSQMYVCDMQDEQVDDGYSSPQEELGYNG